MRYITQIAESPNYRLAIYDAHEGGPIAIFKDIELAEWLKDQLNEAHQRNVRKNENADGHTG